MAKKAPAAGVAPVAGGPVSDDGLEMATAATAPEDAIVSLEGTDMPLDDVIALDASGLAPEATAALAAELPGVAIVKDGERLVYALCTIDDGTAVHAAESYLALPADEAERLIAIGAALDPDAPAFPHRATP